MKEQREVKVSVVIPAYNEAGNIPDLVDRLNQAMGVFDDWELVFVNDGSTDNTLEVIKQKAAGRENIKVISFPRNRGQGNALKAGFAAAHGEVIVTVDADMSYSPADVPKLVKVLAEDEALDIVIGSPFKRGGGMHGVSFVRRVLSRGANTILGLALPGHLRTLTGMFRAYRQPILTVFELESGGKEIHFEVLSKGLAVGARVEEVPVIMKGRERGVSKTHIRAGIISHLLFSFFERPAILFEAIGFLMFLLGLISGFYIIYLWRTHALDPTRPLMILMVLLIVVGALVLSFGFIASQIAQVRKEIYRVQRENLELANRLREHRRGDDRLEK